MAGTKRSPWQEIRYNSEQSTRQRKLEALETPRPPPLVERDALYHNSITTKLDVYVSYPAGTVRFTWGPPKCGTPMRSSSSSMPTSPTMYT